MLDFFGIIAVTMCIVIVLVLFTYAFQISPRARLVFAIAVGVWIGLAVAFGSIGEFLDAGRRPVPLIGIMFATPLIVIAVIAWRSPAARRAMLSVPMPLLVGLNVLRLIGGSFLLLAAAGRLGGPFPSSAGWGDIIAAVFAIPAAWLAVRAATDRDWLIGAWNYFGALDLFVAVGLATLSTPGSPFQLIPTSVGPAAMQYLPWVLIPTVLVPYLLIAHGIIFAQLRARARR